jgi:hypothetical protein
MEDISNKTILMLVMTALVVSLAGTMISLNKLSNMGGTYTVLNKVTGAVTTEGNATITTSGTVSITLTSAVIAIPAGYVNASCPDKFAIIPTYSGGQATCWLNTSNVEPSTDDLTSQHVIQNDGTVLVNVTATTSTTDAEEFLCESTNGCFSSSAHVTLSTTQNEAGSCDTTQTNVTLLTFSSNVTAKICDAFDYVDGSDEINVSMFELRIPSDAPTGAKTLTIDYVAKERT